MEWPQLATDAIRAIAWPAVACYAISVFRKDITHLIDGRRLSKASIGSIRLDFAEGVVLAKRAAMAAKEGSVGTWKSVGTQGLLSPADTNARLLGAGLKASPSGLDFGLYKRKAAQHACQALDDLASELAIMIQNIAEFRGIPLKPGVSTMRVVHLVFLDHGINRQQYSLLKRVLHLCKEAQAGGYVSAGQAVAVIEFSEVLKDQYHQWISQDAEFAIRKRAFGEHAHAADDGKVT